ncbi:MAG: nuclear transport factor 2 family protein [Pseudomonadota bacterium]
MPTPERLEAFIDTVVSGEHVRAITDFYHADASMQENSEPPRRGRDGLVAHEQASLKRIQSITTHRPDRVLLDGDRVAISWVFDIVDAKGDKRRLSEVALQDWSGDRIMREQFVYDSARAWHKLGAQA